MSSRLFQEIREKRGLVYSVFGYFRPFMDVGQGVMYAGTDLVVSKRPPRHSSVSYGNCATKRCRKRNCAARKSCARAAC